MRGYTRPSWRPGAVSRDRRSSMNRLGQWMVAVAVVGLATGGATAQETEAHPADSRRGRARDHQAGHAGRRHRSGHDVRRPQSGDDGRDRRPEGRGELVRQGRQPGDRRHLPPSAAAEVGRDHQHHAAHAAQSGDEQQPVPVQPWQRDDQDDDRAEARSAEGRRRRPTVAFRPAPARRGPCCVRRTPTRLRQRREPIDQAAGARHAPRLAAQRLEQQPRPQRGTAPAR